MEELLNEASNKKQEIVEGDNSTSATQDYASENEIQKEISDLKGVEEVQTKLIQDEQHEIVLPLTEEKESVLNDEQNSKLDEHQDSLQNETIQKGENAQEQPSKEDQISSSTINYPILMKKLTKSGDRFYTGKWAKEEYAHDEKEYRDLRHKNFAPEDFFKPGLMFANLDD